MSRSKNWCFTLQCELKEAKLDWKEGEYHLVYCVWQIERAPTTGKTHIQGYIHLDLVEALSYMKRHYSNEAHWEICKGSPKQNIAYCTKNESRINGPFTIGDESKISSQGQRNDLKAMVEAKIMGASNTDLVDQFGDKFCLHWKSIGQLAESIISENINQSECKKIKIIYMYGPSRSGKSYTSRKIFPGSYIKNPDTIWWDNYNNEKSVIFDDLRSIDPKLIATWLRWLDNYYLQEQVKGGHKILSYTTAIITSNWLPEKVCADLAFLKRIHEIWTFKERKNDEDEASYVIKKYTPPLLASLATAVTKAI